MLSSLYIRSRSSAQHIVSTVPGSVGVERVCNAHNLVISLVPYIYHAAVIRLAINNKVSVVNTSYVSPAIKELENAAKEAGIVVLNKVGVDPGMDHLYAVQKIGEVHAKGGKVCRLSFE